VHFTINRKAEGVAMPNPLIQPYLFFGGCCEEALEF
jgi:hypothetical protein